MNSNEKILYLLHYLSEAPKKIVEGYQFLKTAGPYSEAKKTLEKRFGHPSVVAEAFRKKLENWAKIHPKDGFALRKFADFLKTCELNQGANALATGVKEKLPSHMESGKNAKKRACHWCGRTTHEIGTCQEFVNKPINERTQFIIRKGRFLRCLTHGHMAKEKKCERVPSCGKCKQKHPTCLHDDSRTSTNVTDGADKVTPEASTNCINAVGAENRRCSEDATVKCTSVCSIEGQ